MAKHRDFRQKVAKKDKVIVYLDASSLIRLASLIDPQDITGDSPNPNRTLASFVEHLGKLGVEFIIPESVMFESTGHRATGDKLTNQFVRDIEYPHLCRFLAEVEWGRVENVSIVRTPFANEHFAKLEKFRDDYPAFNRYIRENLVGFGDRDIATLFDQSTDKGHLFLVTEDRGLTERLVEAQNKSGRPIAVMDTLYFCSQTQKTAPIRWLDPKIDWQDDEVGTDKIKEYLNAFYDHDNKRRIAEGRAETKGLNWKYKKRNKGFLQTPDGELDFAGALNALLTSKERRL